MSRRIILIYGGESPEHEVSVSSARHASQHLTGAIIPVGITRQGGWFLQSEITGDMQQRHRVTASFSEGLVCQQRLLQAEAVFPLLHGPCGEDGTVQGLFELLDYPLASPSVLASAVGMSKQASKLLCRSLGIPVVQFQMLRPEADPSGISMPLPVFVKPDRGGSSIGISPAFSQQELTHAVSLARRYDRRVIIEQQITGIEIQIAWICSGGALHLSCPGEIRTRDGFHSFETKYRDVSRVDHIIPSSLPSEVQGRIREYAETLIDALGEPLYGRMDFFFETDTGKLYFNEYNTIPGMTPESMFPLLWEHSGISFRCALDMIITGAITAKEKEPWVP